MTSLDKTILENTIVVDINLFVEPTWSHRLERWFQLDSEGIAICKALEEWIKGSEVNKAPDLIIQSSFSGSHLADFNFTRSGADSPTKFVYTLPNVIIGVMAQFLNWQGPSFNFTGEKSWDTSEQFAELWLNSSQTNKSVLIVSVDVKKENDQYRNVRFKQIQKNHGDLT